MLSGVTASKGKGTTGDIFLDKIGLSQRIGPSCCHLVPPGIRYCTYIKQAKIVRGTLFASPRSHGLTAPTGIEGDISIVENRTQKSIAARSLKGAVSLRDAN